VIGTQNTEKNGKSLQEHRRQTEKSTPRPCKHSAGLNELRAASGRSPTLYSPSTRAEAARGDPFQLQTHTSATFLFFGFASK